MADARVDVAVEQLPVGRLDRRGAVHVADIEPPVDPGDEALPCLTDRRLEAVPAPLAAPLGDLVRREEQRGSRALEGDVADLLILQCVSPTTIE